MVRRVASRADTHAGCEAAGQGSQHHPRCSLLTAGRSSGTSGILHSGSVDAF